MRSGAAAVRLTTPRIAVLIYVVCLCVYLLFAGSRLWHLPPGWHQHYTYLSQGFLEGRLSLKGRPPHGNDWAKVTTLELDDGRKIRGQFLRKSAGKIFRTTRGEDLRVNRENIGRQQNTYYVSFPWFPALLMLPFILIWGVGFNDVIFTVAIAALNPVLLFLILQKLKELNLSARTLRENLWLVSMFAFGTVHFYSSVLGQVWHTAHMVAVALLGFYILASLDARRPFWAGACLGAAFATRPSTLFTFPFLVFEVWRNSSNVSPASLKSRGIATIRQLIPAGCALSVFLIAAMALNFIRFDSVFEFGHTFLDIRWSERIQRWGNFNVHFAPRNLFAFFLMMPRLFRHSPYLQVNYHGLSLFFTTPIFATVFLPKRKSPLAFPAWMSIFGPFVLHALYQNTGFVQFGYRFSLDFILFLMVLVATGGRPINLTAKLLILWGVLVNTFGALTFLRLHQFYWY